MLRPFPRISCSLLAAREQDVDLRSVVRDMEHLGVDMIHYDVSDQSDALDLAELDSLRKLTSLPFDIHLSVAEPLGYLKNLTLSEDDYFSLHVENELSHEELVTLKIQLGCHFGLALNTETAVDTLLALMPPVSEEQLIDFSLFMAAAPGVSGGSFDDLVVDKIKTFRRRCPNVPIHVDGGVNGSSAALLRDVGVDVMISGSYIFKAEDSIRQVTTLLGRNLHRQVSEIMRPLAESPGVKPQDPIRVVAKEIESKGVGCTCVVDDTERLLGLITDGDLRRQLITRADLSEVLAQDLMSELPFATTPTTRLLDLFRSMDKTGANFSVVPVIHESKLRGLFYLQDILFNDVS